MRFAFYCLFVTYCLHFFQLVNSFFNLALLRRNSIHVGIPIFTKNTTSFTNESFTDPGMYFITDFIGFAAVAIFVFLVYMPIVALIFILTKSIFLVLTNFLLHLTSFFRMFNFLIRGLIYNIYAPFQWSDVFKWQKMLPICQQHKHNTNCNWICPQHITFRTFDIHMAHLSEKPIH